MSGYNLTHSPALEGCRERVTALEAENAELRAAVTSLGAALMGAVSLLEKTPEAKQHMPSDKAFGELMAGFARRIEQGRAALRGQP